jgi:hypothetical protein
MRQMQQMPSLAYSQKFVRLEIINKLGAAAFIKSCFPCHQKAKDSDLVVTRYAS